MLRDLLKEGGLYSVANLLTKGISLLLIPFYTAYFSPEDYGVIDILVVFGTIVTTIISLQLNQGLGRYVGEADTPEEERKTIASTAILFVLFGYLVITAFFFLFPNPIIQLLSNEEVSIPVNTFYLAVGAVSINGMFYMLGVYLRFQRKSKPYAFISFLHAFLNILLTIYLVLGKDMGIDGIYVASIIIAPVIIALQLYVLRNDLRLRFSNSHLRKLFRFSIPLVPAAMAYVILNFIDRIYIKEYLSFADEGIYGIGTKFASAISIIILGFSSALAPILYQKHKDEQSQADLGRIFRLFFATGTTGVLLLSVFSHETLVVFTQEEYYQAGTIMPILYLSILITGLGMFSPGLYIKEKTKIIPFIVILASLINVGLNYILITQFELIGAAVATAISISINNFLLFSFSQHYYPIPFPKAQMISFQFIFFIFWAVGSYWLNTVGLELVPLVLIKVAMVIVYFMLLIWAKMISLDKLKQFVFK